MSKGGATPWVDQRIISLHAYPPLAVRLSRESHSLSLALTLVAAGPCAPPFILLVRRVFLSCVGWHVVCGWSWCVMAAMAEGVHFSWRWSSPPHAAASPWRPQSPSQWTS